MSNQSIPDLPNTSNYHTASVQKGQKAALLEELAAHPAVGMSSGSFNVDKRSPYSSSTRIKRNFNNSSATKKQSIRAGVLQSKSRLAVASSGDGSDKKEINSGVTEPNATVEAGPSQEQPRFATPLSN